MQGKHLKQTSVYLLSSYWFSLENGNKDIRQNASFYACTHGSFIIRCTSISFIDSLKRSFQKSKFALVTVTEFTEPYNR